MYPPDVRGRERAGSRSSRRRQQRGDGRQTWAAVGLAAVSTVLPGAGHIWSGRRRSGIPILVTFLLLVGVGAFLYAGVDRMKLVSYLIDTNVLLAVIVCALLLAVGWSAVIVSAYHIKRPGRVGPLHGLLSAFVIGVLSLAVSTPPIYAAHYAYVGRDVLTKVFPGDEKKERKTKKGKDPWAGRPRINVLLLGGDGGNNREGVRTDSMTVASIDTHTGDTVMFSLPRNMLSAPVPPRLREQFPDGTFDDLLNAVYEYGEQNPKLFSQGSNPGAQATQEVIQEILGLKIDYYALVNLRAFTEIIDAIGGITVYVEKDLPIGPHGQTTGYVRKGVRHLNGKKALWYARSRNADDDYHRMSRQRCVFGAIARQADPATVLRGFQKIAAATKKNVSTDIPNDDLPALLQLGEKAKTAEITSLQFTPPEGYETGNPDYPKIKRAVDKAIEEAEATPTASPSTNPTASPTKSPGGEGKKKKDKPASLDDVCRYS